MFLNLLKLFRNGSKEEMERLLEMRKKK